MADRIDVPARPLPSPSVTLRSRAHPVLTRVVSCLALALAAALALSPGRASAQTPGLIVDVASGKVLFAERATDPWYPASITKLMTVYVALDMVRRGEITMNSLMTMTENAAAMPPSKLGLKVGQGLTLENAIKVIMVKSANDVAAMIGENLGGGSIEAFAVRMNEASRRIGMRESRWFNANGLPDDRQQTSARDMALLARALLTEFPEEQGLFNIGALKLGREIMRNHNGLLGRYEGADGMKTGFICSGGFNVVATATRGGRRLIAVVMGYPSAKERDMRTADLLDQGFGSFGWGAQSLESLPPSGSISPQNMRQVICGPKRRHPEEDDEPAVVSSASSNADNPIAALFSPSSAAATATGTAILGSRRDLGPRVAFEPISIWIGATPGESADRPSPATRLAGARKVRTQKVTRASAPGPAAQAFTSAAATPSIVRQPAETVKASRRPTSRAELRDSLDPKPAAETRPRHGAITARAAPVEGTNPDDAKPVTRKLAAKPKAEAAKPKPKPTSDE